MCLIYKALFIDLSCDCTQRNGAEKKTVDMLVSHNIKSYSMKKVHWLGQELLLA